MKRIGSFLLAGLAALVSVQLLSGCSTPDQDVTTAAVNAEDLFLQNCANCHGVYGEGDGPVAAILSINPPDLRQISRRNQGEFPHEVIVQIIDGRTLRNGHDLPGMPVWGDMFAPPDMAENEANALVTQRVSALANYLESIQR